jgi:Subtilase family
MNDDTGGRRRPWRIWPPGTGAGRRPVRPRASSGRAGGLAVLVAAAALALGGCSGSSGSAVTVPERAATPSGSATAVSPAMMVATTVPTGPAPSDVARNCLPAPTGLPPGIPAISCLGLHQYRVAYGIDPLLGQGIDGRGETVTVVSPAPSPNESAGSNDPPAASDVRQDLAAFDGEFGLPAARLQVVTALAGAGSPWRATPEEVSDFEVVHTVAPAATLRVVLLPSDVLDSAANATADMLAALRLAVSGTDVASISWSLGEHYFTRAQVTEMHSILLAAAADHVTVDASSGDYGASSDPWWGTPDKEVSLPAADPLVLAVGGTALTANNSTGAYIGETTMGLGHGGPGGSGGGFSHRYTRPAYQDGVPGIAKTRGVPDVAGAGSGSLLPIAFAVGGKTYIMPLGGTSASAPLWGGLAALAGQYAHHDLGFVNPAIYRIAGSSSYQKAFHDVTTGNNTVTIRSVTVTGYQAAPGWDPVTGWGSPNAQVLIPLLARLTARGTPGFPTAGAAIGAAARGARAAVLGELTGAETAEALGCPDGTVKSVGSRGLTRLRGLADDWNDTAATCGQ